LLPIVQGRVGVSFGGNGLALRKKILSMLVGSIVLIAGTGLVHAEIYKCRHGDGTLFYTDTPCKYTSGSVRIPLKRKISGTAPIGQSPVSARPRPVNRALRNRRPDYGDR